MDEEPGLLARLDPAVRLALVRSLVGVAAGWTTCLLCSCPGFAFLVVGLLALGLGALAWVERRLTSCAPTWPRHLLGGLLVALLAGVVLFGAVLQGAVLVARDQGDSLTLLAYLVRHVREEPRWLVVVASDLVLPASACGVACLCRLRLAALGPVRGQAWAFLVALALAEWVGWSCERVASALGGLLAALALLAAYALCDWPLRFLGSEDPGPDAEGRPRSQGRLAAGAIALALAIPPLLWIGQGHALASPAYARGVPLGAELPGDLRVEPRPGEPDGAVDWRRPALLADRNGRADPTRARASSGLRAGRRGPRPLGERPPQRYARVRGGAAGAGPHG